MKEYDAKIKYLESENSRLLSSLPKQQPSDLLALQLAESKETE